MLSPSNFAQLSSAVAITNFPQTQPVSIDGSIDANISNFPSSFAITSLPNVTVANPVNSVSINGQVVIDTNQYVQLAQNSSLQYMIGQLDSIKNGIPITNPVSSVSINNFPSVLPVLVNNADPIPVSGSISISNLPSTQNVNDVNANSQLSNIYNKIQNSRGSMQLWNGSIVQGGYSNVLDLSTKNVRNLTIYGQQDSANNILTVLFSSDNITFYRSQFSYTCSVTGDYGFSINACPMYVLIQSQNACNLKVFVDYA